MIVLFICNGNVARSQEAALYFERYKTNPDDIAISAGIHPELDKPINLTVIQVMAEDGISMEGCFRKALTADMIESAGHIVTFVPTDLLPSSVQKHSHLEYWNILDPRHQDEAFHRTVRDTIKKRVIHLIENFA